MVALCKLHIVVGQSGINLQKQVTVEKPVFLAILVGVAYVWGTVGGIPLQLTVVTSRVQENHIVAAAIGCIA